jgi:hypothetical protein
MVTLRFLGLPGVLINSSNMQSRAISATYNIWTFSPKNAILCTVSKFGTKITYSTTLTFWSKLWGDLPEGEMNKAFEGLL